MKNVRYNGFASRATVGSHTWNGHGDTIAVSDEDADKLATDKRFSLPGGPVPDSGASTSTSGGDDPDADKGSAPKAKRGD